MQKETVPKALRWMENDLGSIARYIWLNVKDKFQREIHLRALLGDAYAQIQDEIENDVPCSVQDVSIREMSASAYGRELYNAQVFLLKNVVEVVKNQKNQEERTERAISLLMERQNNHEQAISEIKSTVEHIAQEQKKFFNEFKEIQTTTVKEQNRLTDAVGQLQEEIRQKTDAITEKLKTDSQAVAELKAVTISAEKEQKSLSAEVMRIQKDTTEQSVKIIDRLDTNSEKLRNLNDLVINTEQQQKKLSADIHQVQKEIRQKTDAITKKLEGDSQAVAELKAVTISAEKEQKSLSTEVMRIQESLNGLIESTNETKRKQDLIYAMQFWEDKRKFEKFIGRWKLVKGEKNGVEENISRWTVQSFSFENVPEGVMWKEYGKDGSEYDSFIFTTDEEIKNKLDKEGKRCDLVEFQSDGSFRWLNTTVNVEGNHLIERWRGEVSILEKC